MKVPKSPRMDLPLLEAKEKFFELLYQEHKLTAKIRELELKRMDLEKQMKPFEEIFLVYPRREQCGDLRAGPQRCAARGGFEYRVICGVAQPDSHGAQLFEARFDFIGRTVCELGFQL